MCIILIGMDLSLDTHSWTTLYKNISFIASKFTRFVALEV